MGGAEQLTHRSFNEVRPSNTPSGREGSWSIFINFLIQASKTSKQRREREREREQAKRIKSGHTGEEREEEKKIMLPVSTLAKYIKTSLSYSSVSCPRPAKAPASTSERYRLFMVLRKPTTKYQQDKVSGGRGGDRMPVAPTS